jgi:hypothetical protein
MTELRGCYADNDSAFTIKADTRRELKAALLSEADFLRSSDAIGLSNRNVTALAALAWRQRKAASVYPFVLPFRYPQQGSDCMGLFVYVATRADYLEAQNQEY